MRLKSIEIKGFKSFGDKVAIHFNDGVTGIVGPNGCGKSNVVDAIRWVLGEQKSRMLRSDKMENVLFNGTKNRKQAALAEVNLSFENSRNILPTAFNEVTITRRLYRTGDSEYLLNGVNCRLKDITNLFLDTGIGSDSYAIMELKMIDDILNDKDNSRRQLFEEASGVSKYKIRKKETLAKLEDTQADLERVEDLLFEIDKNMKALQAQARKTERYYKLKAEYKKLSLDLAWYSLRAFHQQSEQLQTEENQLSDQKQAIDASIAKLEANMQQIKLAILDKEKVLTTRQKATNDHIAAIRQYENEQKLQNEKHRFLTEKEAALQKQLKEDADHQAYIQQELQNQIALAEQLSQQLAIARETMETKQGELTAHRQLLQTKKLELDQNQLLSQELQSAVHTLEKQVALERMQLHALSQEMERNQAESEQRSTEISQFHQNLQELEQQKEALTAEVDQLEQFEKQLADRIQRLQQQIEQSKVRIADLNRQNDKLTNEYQLTKSLVDNLEGYPESLKFLKKSPGWTKNAQLLSDIISCKPEFKAAIENYLEPWLNYYVVNTYAEARAGIELLANATKGRANFFVLEAFNNYIQAEPILVSGCIPALNIAECDIQFANLINHLLGHVYLHEVQDGYEEAHALLTAKHPEAVLISRNGRFTGSRHFLSGGSMGLFEGKRIGRKRNLEILQKQMASLDQQLKEEQGLLHNLNRQEQEAKAATKQQVLTQTKDKLQKVTGDWRLVKSQQDQHEKFLAANQNRKEELEAKYKATLEKLEAWEPMLVQKTAENAKQQNLLIDNQSAYDQLNEVVQLKSTAFNEANVAFHQSQNRHNSVQQDINFKQSQLEIINKRTKDNSLLIKDVQLQLKEVLSSTDFSDTRLLEMYEQKEAMEAAVVEAEQDWFKERGRLEADEEALRELRKQKEQQAYLFNELKERGLALRLQETSLTERLAVEFEMDAQDLRERVEIPELSAEKLKNELSEMKSRLENFGPINPMAVEAYQEIETRYGFISTQKEDLLAAKSTLIETMSEIDATAREKFMEAFTVIRENFVNVFRSLFTEEDTCDLLLTNEDNPLDAAIHIIARPKGKKPLTINQLSGGEKTLTATALLFAIYLYKPAPFCIFDEVDAPLDDNNIDKFNRLIRKFSDNSQFIIVTHNKKTMETTDIIYGVTMIEQGVSRVVPVDFRNLSLN
jgi:chromosome segregation protein